MSKRYPLAKRRDTAISLSPRQARSAALSPLVSMLDSAYCKARKAFDKLPQKKWFGMDDHMDDLAQKTNAGKRPTPAEQRELRLEQQLRGNLQKRKAQARARREDPAAQNNPAGEAETPLPPGPRSD